MTPPPPTPPPPGPGRSEPGDAERGRRTGVTGRTVQIAAFCDVLEQDARVLDLPGSMVRDVLAAENPFDQFLDPILSLH